MSQEHCPAQIELGKISEKHTDRIANVDKRLAVIESRVDGLESKTEATSKQVITLNEKAIYFTGIVVMLAFLAPYTLPKLLGS